jgi:hypothetical protein
METLNRHGLTVFLFLSIALLSSHSWAENKPFDHFSTGFELRGAHQDLQCESCHQRGIFAGTPRACKQCHERNGLLDTSFKPQGHIPTSGNCNSCHNSFNWQEITRVDHSMLPQNCALCHNGRSAEGKPVNHVVSSQQCELCHSSIAWVPASFNHNSVNQPCFSCHNNTIATGKNSRHIQTNQDCQSCHSTFGWVPATFNHAGVTGNCQSCHNGVQAEGKDNDHVLTNQDCNACHSTVAWEPANFSHAGVTGNCQSCHNGSTATGKDNGHFQTSLDCSSCHSKVAWQPDKFSHRSPNYPGQHSRNLGCTDCHTTNAQAISWRFAAYQPACAGCHAGDFKPGPHKKHENPDVKYSVSELRNCTGACHVYTNNSLTTIKDFRSGEHRVSDGDF